MKRIAWIGLAVLGLLLAACQDSGPRSGSMTITVQVDGDKLIYPYSKPISVGAFLQEIGVVLGENDEVNPLLQSQIRDGMLITVTRVRVEEECENEPVGYGTQRQPVQGLAPGVTQLAQPGQDGVVQVCYRITYKDGVQASRVEYSRVTIKPPVDRVIFVGAEPPSTLLPITGVITFISGGQAWIIEGSTANLTPLTEEGYLDGRVFDLSADGRQLLYTRRTADPEDPGFSNELWAILNTRASDVKPVQLLPEDVRAAQWTPGRRFTVSYSTANPIAEPPGWRALNDVFVMPLDPSTGASLADGFEELVPANALGSYAYWGRRFAWSPDGQQLAWANADSVGLVDLASGEFVTLAAFKEYAPLLTAYQGAAVWTPTLAWSDDGYLITTLHGPPYAGESPEDSIVFDLAVLDVKNNLQYAPFKSQAGIWAAPAYSPLVEGPDGTPTYSIAFFKARNPLNSPGAEYDLWVADRDGSNARAVFPGANLPGLRSPDPEDGIAWSPDAQQIALIHQGNLWVVDLRSGEGYPVTSDGHASRPRWSRAS